MLFVDPDSSGPAAAGNIAIMDTNVQHDSDSSSSFDDDTQVLSSGVSGGSVLGS